ncbi:MAG: LysM peptidoglycan-binding domain-containing protein, partial [Chloroflexi bacterium]|nr:LysM peptidoglycan-binding domain-containing protein [Chloroflexota bacterium]
GDGQTSNPSQLTPYLTLTAAIRPTLAATTAPQLTATPAPTATPLIHVLALGETISSLALRYGLDMGTVLAANPGLNPNALTVGTEIIIPVGDSGPQIGMVSEPLKLKIGSPDCVITFEKGLWCFVKVENPLEQSSTVVVVSVSLSDSTGKNLKQINAPLLLHKIDPGQIIPVMAYFAPPIPSAVTATAELISALPLSDSRRSFLPAVIVNEEINLTGRTSYVSGEVEIEGEPGDSTILRVAAIAYDANGRLVGARRWEKEVTLEPGDAVDFSLQLFSSGGSIERVIIFAEAYQDNL